MFKHLLLKWGRFKWYVSLYTCQYPWVWVFLLSFRIRKVYFAKFKECNCRCHHIPKLFKSLEKNVAWGKCKTLLALLKLKALRGWEAAFFFLCPCLKMHIDDTANGTISFATTWVIMCSVNLYNIESSSQKVIYFFKNWKENKYGAVKLLSRGIYLDISQNISLCWQFPEVLSRVL